MTSYVSNSILPKRVAQFIEATNAGDLLGILDVFTADAIINDQLQQWCGLAELTEWATQDIIGQQLSIHPTYCLHHYGHCIVKADVDGEFDKRGLPDPLEILLYFTLAVDKVVQLIILRDRSGTSAFVKS